MEAKQPQYTCVLCGQLCTGFGHNAMILVTFL
jgi:hypothetical protein